MLDTSIILSYSNRGVGGWWVTPHSQSSPQLSPPEWPYLCIAGRVCRGPSSQRLLTLKSPRKWSSESHGRESCVYVATVRAEQREHGSNYMLTIISPKTSAETSRQPGKGRGTERNKEPEWHVTLRKFADLFLPFLSRNGLEKRTFWG